MVQTINDHRSRNSHCALTCSICFAIAFALVCSLSIAFSADNPPRAIEGENSTPTPKHRATHEERTQDTIALCAAEGEIDARQVRIEEELPTITDSDLPADHWAREWAGEYYVGDGLGMNVRILVAPKSGIVYTWHGCLGLYDGNHGDVIESFDLDKDGKADGLKINWSLHPKSGYDYNSEQYYFVRWNGADGKVARHYLVPESQLLSMVNDYNEGGYARDGMYSAPLKSDPSSNRPRAASKPVVGAPQLPDKWAKLLLTSPVDAKVTHASEPTFRNVTGNVNGTFAKVTFDKGSEDGLYLGLKAWFNQYSLQAARLTIIELDKHSAVAEFRAFSSQEMAVELPKVGDSIRLIDGSEKPKSDD